MHVLTEVGSSSLELPAGETILRAGRLAVRSQGDVVLAFPDRQAVYHLPSGPDATWRILAGVPDATGSIDGTGTAARFNQPGSAVFGPDGHVLVADRASRALRRIVLATGEVSTVSGVPTEAEGYRNGRAVRALYRRPYALAVRGHDLYVSDPLARRIRLLSGEGGAFLVAGTGAAGSQDGSALEASFQVPAEIRVDADGNLWVLDGDLVSDSEAAFTIRRIRQVTPP
jgi:hypothetical protein